MASKTIGVVNVRLGLQSAAFGKGIKAAQGQLLHFEAAVTKVTRGILSFKNAVLGLAGVGGMGFLIKQSFAAGDSIAKMSDRLGISTEALQAYRVGADLAGVSVEELDLAITNLQRSIVDATQGEKGAQNQFAMLGLDPQALRAANPEQQILHVSEAISKLRDQALKTDLVKELFGKGGRNFERFISEGAAGLERMKEEAQALGVAFNRVELGRLEQTNDAFSRLGTALRGLVDTAAIELAPKLTLLVNKTTAWVSEWSNVRQFATAAFDTIASGLDVIESALGGVEGALLRIEKAWRFLAGTQKAMGSGALSFLGGGSLAARGARAFGAGVNAASGDALRVAEIDARLEDISRGGGKKFSDMLREAIDMLDKFQGHLLGIPDLLRAPIDPLLSNFVGPPDSLMGVASKLEKVFGPAFATSQFGIGFRDIQMGDLPFVTNRTIFGEQQGEMLSLEKQQTALLERIAVGVENVGELN